MFGGVLVDLPTPFTLENYLDEEAWKRLLKFHLQEDSSGVIVGGLLGEGFTLTETEKYHLLKIATETLNGNIPVIGAILEGNPHKLLELVRKTRKFPLDALLLYTPPFSNASWAGIISLIKEITHATSHPIIILDLEALFTEIEALQQLCTMERVVGYAIHQFNVDHLINVYSWCRQRVTPLIADDSHLLPALSLGARGAISIIGNWVPGKVKTIIQDYQSGEITSALHQFMALHPYFKIIKDYHPAVATKIILKERGILNTAQVRLPLHPLTDGLYEEFLSRWKRISKII